MHRTPRARRTQRGNILFIILLAVVLFAALNYAVTSSMRGGGKDASEESARALAAQIIQQAVLVEQTVNRLRLINGCTSEQISFENNVVSGYTNPNAPSSKHCHVFDPGGGGLNWQEPPSKSLVNSPETWVFSGSDCVSFVGTGGNGDCWNNGSNSDNELLMTLRGLSESICREVNAQAGVTIMPFLPTTTGNIFNSGRRATFKWSGNFNAQHATQGGHHFGNGIDGRHAACYRKGTDVGELYSYYHVLIAR